MSGWESILIAAIPTLGVSFSAWVSTRDLRLRRQMETLDRFLRIAATAQARGRGDDHIGTSEQVAAIQLLTELGLREKGLRLAAVASLRETVRWSEAALRESEGGCRDNSTLQVIYGSALDALARLPVQGQ